MDAFHDLVFQAGNVACEEWGYPPVGDASWEIVEAWLPPGIRRGLLD